MKVLLTGGGTGGHITPILAVAHELKQTAGKRHISDENLRSDAQRTLNTLSLRYSISDQTVANPEGSRRAPFSSSPVSACTVIYIGERGSKFDELTRNNPDIDQRYSVFAGKFRRYYGQSWLARLVDVKTNLLNIRDSLYLVLGLIQAWFLLSKIRPDVVFLKGGFVGVPIGLAAAARHIPIVTHDSDALPGLANRLVGRWARVHATALPAEYYQYSADKVRPVGVLVEHIYQPVTDAMQNAYKKQIGLSQTVPLLLITGGSSGAQRINKAVAAIIGELLQKIPALHVIHQVGQGKAGVYGEYSHDRLKILEFMKPMYVYMGAADLVVARASGNTLAELGTQGKACIVIPNPDLTGGHQLKNAKLLQQHNAAKVLQESDLYDNKTGLLSAITELLNDKSQRQKLAANLQSITITGAARKLAQLILDQAQNQQIKS